MELSPKAAYIPTMSINGKDTGDKKIVKFPTLAERDRIKRAEREEEARWKAQNKAAQNQPFFNFGRIPPFTKFMILAIIAAHVALQIFGDSSLRLQTIYTLGFIPNTFSGLYTGTSEFAFTPLTLFTPITHILIHGGWMHLFFNSVMGLTLGMFFEKAYGARITALFFILCGIAGAAVYLLFDPLTTSPLIGSSGATSGLFGAAMILMMEQNPHNPIAQKLGKKGPWPVIIFWGIFMVFLGLIGGEGLAWQAHIGGYIGGVALLTLMRKGKIRL